MMRSLFSGVSGLRVHQNRMDVIGNNIANVNTVGFKASRMTFADAMSQRISGASADNPATGRAGRNPMQIGLGVNVGGIDNIMTQGSAQRTDRPLDLTIEGDGFFIVSDATGVFFTRAGNVDWNGRYFSIGGMRLMGWNAVEDPRNPGSHMIQQGTVEPLATPPSMHMMDPTATSAIETIGNINALEAQHDETMPGTFIIRRPVEFYDTIGNRYTANKTFRWHPPQNHSIFDELGFDRDANGVPIVPTPNPTGLVAPTLFSTNVQSIWTYTFDGPSAGVARVLPAGSNVPVDISVTIGGTRATTSPFEVPAADTGNTGILIFNAHGQLTNTGFSTGIPTNAAITAGTGISVDRSINIHFTTTASGVLLPPAFPGDPGGGAAVAGNPSSISFNFNALRQQEMRTNMRMNFLDGNAPGSLQDIMIGPDGIITGRFSNGHMRELAQIPLAFFRNPAGLERVGNNLWSPTANSGWFDGVGEHGEMMPGTLEMSNVDLSSEFTEMITTQRGFQANSRIITTSDEMIMELVNLRR